MKGRILKKIKFTIRVNFTLNSVLLLVVPMLVVGGISYKTAKEEIDNIQTESKKAVNFMDESLDVVSKTKVLLIILEINSS